MCNTENAAVRIDGQLFTSSYNDPKCKDYTFPSDSNLTGVDSGSKVCCSGQPKGVSVSRGHFNIESDTNYALDGYVDSVVQNTDQQMGINSNQDYFAQPNELISKKQQLLFIQKQNGEGSERRSKHAKFRSYSKLSIRKQSFIGWTSDCSLPIWMFAMAGFFYKGFADIVACFDCGLVYRRWQKDDDPVKKHMQLQPDCPFIADLRSEGIQSFEDLHKFESSSCEENIEISDVSKGQNSVVVTSSSSSSVESTTDSRLQCKVCLSNPLQITIQPCGHFSICEPCYTRLKYENNRCPICRGSIKHTIRTYV